MKNLESDECAMCAHNPDLPMPSPSYHPECGMRMAVGGIGHLIDHDRWCIERSDPDAGLTYRQSARLVYTWVEIFGVEAAVAKGP